MMEFKEITGLIVKPGDRVIVTMPDGTDMQGADEIIHLLRAFAPDVQWALTDPGTGFTVIRDDMKPRLRAQVQCEQTRAHDGHEWLDTRGEDASAIVQCLGIERPEGCPVAHAHSSHVLSTVKHGVVNCPGVA